MISMFRSLIHGLRFHLFILILLAVLPALGLAFYNASEERHHEINLTKETTQIAARMTAHNVESILEGARQLLVSLSRTRIVREHDGAATTERFTDLLPHYPFYTNLIAAKRDGEVFASGVPLSKPVNIGDRGYFRRGVETHGFAVGDYQTGRITEKKNIIFAYPAMDNNNEEIAAVVAVGFDLAALKRIITAAQLPEGAELFIIDRNGTILACHPEPENCSNSVGECLCDLPTIQKILTKSPGIGTVASKDGLEYFYSLSVVEGSSGNIFVIAWIPRRVAVAYAQRNLYRNLIWLGMVAVLTFAVAWFGSKAFLLNRVYGLLKVTKRLAAGDLSVRTGTRGGEGEFDQLDLAFDRMAHSLEESRQQLEQANRDLSLRALLLDAATDSIFLHDFDGHFLYLNEAAYKTRGYSEKAELLELNLHALDVPEYADLIAPRIADLMEKGEATFESAHLRKDRTILPVEIHAQVIQIGDRKLILSDVRDITDRKQREEERDKLVKELQDSLANVKTLRGLIPICASCKKIRNDEGFWQQVEVYVRDHTEAAFSHGICPECVKKNYPGILP